jgi:hypothetical protein
MLKKSDVPVPPPLKKEVVNVPELGGEVLVQGMRLSTRLQSAISKQGFSRVTVSLEHCVLVDGGQDKDGKDIGMVPLFTAEEWEVWGNKNYVAAMNLWGKVFDLSDAGGVEAEKKLEALSSDSPAG